MSIRESVRGFAHIAIAAFAILSSGACRLGASNSSGTPADACAYARAYADKAALEGEILRIEDPSEDRLKSRYPDEEMSSVFVRVTSEIISNPKVVDTSSGTVELSVARSAMETKDFFESAGAPIGSRAVFWIWTAQGAPYIALKETMFSGAEPGTLRDSGRYKSAPLARSFLDRVLTREGFEAECAPAVENAEPAAEGSSP